MPRQPDVTSLDVATIDDIDRYINRLFAPEDAVLRETVASIEAAGMPAIQVSAGQGRFLYLLARLVGARRILELGTLAGYSAIWMARALPDDGRLVTLESDPAHAAVARKNFDRAGLSAKVSIVVGPAATTLAAMVKRGEPPFDLIFIDADKHNYSVYLDWSLQLSRPGTLIAADNVIRAGKALKPPADDQAASGAHEFNAKLAADPRVEAIILQQVGLKGHDGLALARVR